MRSVLVYALTHNKESMSANNRIQSGNGSLVATYCHQGPEDTAVNPVHLLNDVRPFERFHLNDECS